MRKLLVLIILLAGCHYSPSERQKFGIFIASQLADGYTTDRNIKAGAVELNPLMSDRPDTEEIIIFKAAVVGGIYLLGELFPEQREGFILIGTISGFGAAGWNELNYHTSGR
jgi:hypothetical protein